MAQFTTNAERFDPYKNFKFRVKWDGNYVAGVSKVSAMKRIQEGMHAGEVVTGLLYVDPTPSDLHANLNTVDVPLNTLNAPELCPGTSALDKINASLR